MALPSPPAALDRSLISARDQRAGYPAELMDATDVNPVMNKPSFEGPDCLLPGTAA
jgi:hypothetical protein